MNKQNIKKKPLRRFVSVCAIAALAGALLAIARYADEPLMNVLLRAT